MPPAGFGFGEELNMQFSVGDKVVHPYYGPGEVIAVEREDLMDGPKRYYVIEIPGQGLTVRIPLRQIDQVGVRLAMTRTRLQLVLDTLRSRPHALPDDYNERQEQVWEKLKTARALKTAEVVRDLAWRQKTAHLTKRDSELLHRGLDFLAAEVALITGSDVSDASEVLRTALTVAMTSASNTARSQ
jgi:CarD family transcriptional regulator